LSNLTDDVLDILSNKTTPRKSAKKERSTGKFAISISKKKTSIEKHDNIEKSIESRLKNGSITSVIKSSQSSSIKKPIIFKLHETSEPLRIPR